MRKALIAAVDAYREPYTLYAGVNDLADIGDILRMSGFSITTLYNSQATKAAILAGLRSLVQNAQPRESISFAFFGHGGQMPSSEDDGYSECLCAYDWESGGLVWDREIDAIMAGIEPGVTCDMFFGCCFAGGLVEVPGADVISWQACREEEYSASVKLDGVWRGLFPMFLRQAYYATPLGTRDDIFRHIAYWTTFYVPTQHPVMRCTESEGRQLLFI